MDHFQVIYPSALLVPYIEQYWFVRIEDIERCSQRMVPFGKLSMSFYRDCRTYSLHENAYLPDSPLYGMSMTYTDILLSGTVDFICVVFKASGASSFFRMPLNELYGRYVALNALTAPDLHELEQHLREEPDTMKCVNLIERFLLLRIERIERNEDKRMAAVMDSIQMGETDIGRLAGTACLSYKQFKRVFTESVGMNPKEYLRVIRFQKLYRLLQLHTDASLAVLADYCGYYDKSHLIREIKELSGFTPAGLQAACDPVYSGYHSLFRSAFVDLPPDFFKPI